MKTPTDSIDRLYYQAVPEKGFAERLLIVARNHIYRDFTKCMRPTASDKILDVGVSDVINDGANVLERTYPHQNNITACGLGEGNAFKIAFPEATYIQILPNKRLPFADNSFDIATSNAVLEHVGSFANQILFVKELCRIAPRVFISVPNRFFPVEHHTALPLVHYSDATFKLACIITGKSEWTKEESLILMDHKILKQISKTINRNAIIGYSGLKLGPFSSNLYLAFI